MLGDSPSREFDAYGPSVDVDDVIGLFDHIDLSPMSDPAQSATSGNALLSAGSHGDDTFNELMQKCRHLAEVLGVHPLVAFLLLESQNWNANRVVDSWATESGHAGVMLSAVGLSLDRAREDPSLRPLAAGGMTDCPVCFGEFPTEELWCLACGHGFCMDCWRDHVNSRIGEGQSHISCLMAGCRCKLPPTSVRQICGEAVYTDLVGFLRDKQVNLADTLANCPNPPCSKPLDIMTMSYCHIVKCGHCRHESCGECKETSHAPATCAEKQKWEMLTDPDLMTRRLLGDNQKICPQCKAQIEKNGGCYVMTCFNCRHQFCWACQRAWSNHTQDHFSCPYYKAEEDHYKKSADDVDSRFIGLFMSNFLKKKMAAAALRDKMKALTQDIQKKTTVDEGTSAEVARAIGALLEQQYWAIENLRWGYVHLFCERYEQVKGLPPAQQVSPNVPPTTPHQDLFERSMKELDDLVTEVEKKIKALQLPSTARMTLGEIMSRTRALGLYRDTMLKQCDSHYRDAREWAVKPH